MPCCAGGRTLRAADLRRRRSPASGKTRLLAWFSGSSVWGWSGYGRSEAAVWLRGMDVEEAVGEVAEQLKLGGGDLAALDRPVLITLADLHTSADPGRMLAELVLPLAADPHVRLLVERRHPTAVADLDVPVFVLDLDDPRATDRDAFTAWYAAERVERSPFTAQPGLPLAGCRRPRRPSGGRGSGPGFADGRAGGACLAGRPVAGRPRRRRHARPHLRPDRPVHLAVAALRRLRDDPEAAARGVAEAAARLPLAEPGLPAYAIGLPSLAEAVALPAAAHGELAAVMRGWPVAAELSPPGYVIRHLARHERLAGGHEAITPLPLRRPRTRVTRELLEGLYGPAGVVRPHDDELHPALTHGPTRRFLTEVGLPVDGVHVDDWTGEDRRFVVSLAESSDAVDELRACEGLPGHLDALFRLDWLQTWHLFLDGRTGLVYEVDEGLETARVAHRGVESYAYFTYVIHRERRLWCDDQDAHSDASYWCAEDLIVELHTYEPEAMAGHDALWPTTLEDYTLLT
ncbi:SUKH-4 family immunity protein [Streptosporangium lutulentum]